MIIILSIIGLVVVTYFICNIVVKAHLYKNIQDAIEEPFLTAKDMQNRVNIANNIGCYLFLFIIGIGIILIIKYA